MSRKGSADYRARELAGLKPLKLLVDRYATVAMLVRMGYLKRAPGAFAGRGFTWPEVVDASERLWCDLQKADVEH